MRKAWLIIRREYVERVRTRSFLISTLLIPAFIYGVTVLPTKLATRKSSGVRHFAVVTSDARAGEAIEKKLDSAKSGNKYELDLKVSDDPALMDELKREIESGSLDGYLWVTNDAIAHGKVQFVAASVSDFVENAELQGAVSTGVVRARLAERGITTEEADRMLKPVEMETVEINGGKENKKAGTAKFFVGFAIAMALYFMLLFYGMAVMRSVLEEKTSRVMEVMLASVNPKELMTGKILGVGAVGLTQVAIWIALALVANSPVLAASKELREVIASSTPILIGAPVYFILGFLMYSGMYAALGAAVNSEQEAQQLQFFVTTPLIIPIILMSMVIRQPDSALSFWLSMVPFFSPILMPVRLSMHAPPLWQSAVAVAVLTGTLYLMLVLSSRIYRIGILMYGKRPTLPEIVRWIKYA